MSAADTGRVVLITGAAGGLGRALASEFASQGWQVMAGVRAVLAEATAANVIQVPLDVTKPDEIKTAVGDLLTRFGRIDALINNAGVTRDAALAQMSDDEWDCVIETNLRGAFLCFKAVARQMIRQGGGHIINISSFGARSGPSGQANYAAAKAGLVGLTQSLAKELGSRNVRVNAIFPGVMPTGMTARMSAPQLDAFANANALGRINCAEEVARFIAFLATTQNISGQLFQLDSRIAPWT
jgi:3-oxoacyl-[acyl-carrier protein] reductase